MNKQLLLWITFVISSLHAGGICPAAGKGDISCLKKNQGLSNFRVAHLYGDADGKIVGAKFFHTLTGAPVFVLQMETVPQVFMWIDTPDTSNRGLAHGLEHLLGRGKKGRYFYLLRDMRLSQSTAATVNDFNFYALSSGTGMDGFFEQFHAWLDALYHPDFSDVEAEREFYHFAVVSDPATKGKVLSEQGTVYDELQSTVGRHTYYFELNKRIFGDHNPFGFDARGIPGEMREVMPQEIRRFHDLYYRLGPTTGFIFAINPKENVAKFLKRISAEFRQISQPIKPSVQQVAAVGDPKYPIHPSDNTNPDIFPFLADNETGPSWIHFAWRPSKSQSLAELRLLELFMRCLAEGQQSLLYKSLVDSKTHKINAGATGVDSQVFVENSPQYPVPIVEVSGVPGNQVSRESIERLRTLVLSKIAEVSQYSDRSEDLSNFNRLVQSYANASRRSERVWINSAPRFGSSEFKTDWKEHFRYLEMEPSFVQSLTEESTWRDIDAFLKSGRNVWRDLILKFHLLDVPYATAAVPSSQVRGELEKAKQDRARKKTDALMAQYHTEDPQEALSRFAQDELAKTKDLDQIGVQISSPHFSEHPPLTPDDAMRYSQFRIRNVPVVASIFDRPPTIDAGFSFDLNKIPAKYYKYLAILPKCLDSLGLNEEGRVVSYSALLGDIRDQTYEFSVGSDVNPASKRADLSVRISATGAEEFRSALSLLRRMLHFNYLDLSNIDRLRDIVARRLSADAAFTKQPEWTMNAAYSFRYQQDRLFLALNSQLTRVHWDERLKWRLHAPVDPAAVDQLGSFAKSILLASSKITKPELSEKLAGLSVRDVERELVEYWKKNLSSFPDGELMEGLQRLTREVQEDLRIGPATTIKEIRELQSIVLTRSALHVDLTLNQSALDEIRPALTNFLDSIPSILKSEDDRSNDQSGPIMARLEQRYHFADDQFPTYVELANPDGVDGNVIFYGDYPGYSNLDRKALIQVLSSKLLGGSGPHSLYTKTWEAGLAYNDGIVGNPGTKLMFYYANRVSDIPSLIGLVNSVAKQIPTLNDQFLIDYALRQTFSIPRSVGSFSQRGRALALDIRDGNPPEKIRRFSEAILALRKDPHLLTQLTNAGILSVSTVLCSDEYLQQQRLAKSLFFFAGPETVLADIEHRLPMHKLLHLWPSDYWIE